MVDVLEGNWGSEMFPESAAAVAIKGKSLGSGISEAEV